MVEDRVGGVGEHEAAVADCDHAFEEVVEFGDGVGRDDKRLLFCYLRGDETPKRGFRLYVEAVGRFVKEQCVYSEGEHVGKLRFLAVAERLLAEVLIARETEFGEVVKKPLHREGGIES